MITITLLSICKIKLDINKLNLIIEYLVAIFVDGGTPNCESIR